eukprot:125529_1
MKIFIYFVFLVGLLGWPASVLAMDEEESLSTGFNNYDELDVEYNLDENDADSQNDNNPDGRVLANNDTSENGRKPYDYPEHGQSCGCTFCKLRFKSPQRDLYTKRVGNFETPLMYKAKTEQKKAPEVKEQKSHGLSANDHGRSRPISNHLGIEDLPNVLDGVVNDARTTPIRGRLNFDNLARDRSDRTMTIESRVRRLHLGTSASNTNLNDVYTITPDSSLVPDMTTEVYENNHDDPTYMYHVNADMVHQQLEFEIADENSDDNITPQPMTDDGELELEYKQDTPHDDVNTLATARIKRKLDFVNSAHDPNDHYGNPAQSPVKRQLNFGNPAYDANEEYNYPIPPGLTRRVDHRNSVPVEPTSLPPRNQSPYSQMVAELISGSVPFQYKDDDQTRNVNPSVYTRIDHSKHGNKKKRPIRYHSYLYCDEPVPIFSSPEETLSPVKKRGHNTKKPLFQNQSNRGYLHKTGLMDFGPYMKIGSSNYHDTMNTKNTGRFKVWEDSGDKENMDPNNIVTTIAYNQLAFRDNDDENADPNIVTTIAYNQLAFPGNDENSNSGSTVVYQSDEAECANDENGCNPGSGKKENVSENNKNDESSYNQFENISPFKFRWNNSSPNSNRWPVWKDSPQLNGNVNGNTDHDDMKTHKDHSATQQDDSDYDEIYQKILRMNLTLLSDKPGNVLCNVTSESVVVMRL